MADFEGILPAIATPMGTDGRFNEAAFREVMEFNIQAGVHGFWVAGGTGESVLLDDDENMAIARAAADQNRGRINNIMHVGAPTTLRAARMAENAAAAGLRLSAAFHRSSTGSPMKRSWSTTERSRLRQTCLCSCTTFPSQRASRLRPS